MLYNKISEDIERALLDRDQKTLEALRYLMAKLKNLAIEQKDGLTDDQVISCVRQQVKQLKDAVDLFKQNNRTELATQYEFQIDAYSKYLPAELSGDDLNKLITDLFETNKTVEGFDPKKFIGIAMSTFKDKASPSRIMPIVQDLLKGTV